MVADRFTGADMLGAGYEPPFPFIPASEYGEKGHTVLPGDFVSAEDGTGIVHTAIAFGEDDFRLGAEQGLNVINPVRADGTYDERIGPYEGRFVKDADDDLIEDLRGARADVPRRAAAAQLPALLALRHAAALLRQAVLVHPHLRGHGPAAGRQRERRLAPRAHQDTAASGRWLENNVDWALGRERYWGTPLPIWRNEAGETVGDRLLRGARASSRASSSRTRTGPFVDDVEIPSPTGGEPLRRVPEVIDVWFDSGLDAVRPVARAVREPGQVRRAVPGRLHLRGDRPDPRLVLQPDRDLDAARSTSSSYKTVLCLGHIADPAGQEDVEVARQHRRAVGRHRPPRRGRVPLVLPDEQAAVGRLPVLAPTRSASRCASSCCSCGTRTAST